MIKTKLSDGVVHKLPADFKKALTANNDAAHAWQDITPLARNEWICWVQSVVKKETRTAHIVRATKDLAAGKRRPCCWVGCTHRTDKPLSPSARWVLGRSKK